MDCLKQEIEFNVKFAKTMLQAQGRLHPMVVGFVGEKRYIFPFIHHDDQEKHALARRIKSELRKLGAEAMMFLTEAWYAQVRNPEMYAMGLGERPTARADRKECLVVSYISRKGNIGIFIPFERTPEGFVFGEAKSEGKTVEDNLWGDVFSGT